MTRSFHAPSFHILKISKCTKHATLRPCSKKHNHYRSKVESHSTACSVVPGTKLSHTRQPAPFYQVQSRVTHDSSLRSTRYKVESHSTSHSVVPGTKSSHTRQHATLCQVQNRAQIDTFYSGFP